MRVGVKKGEKILGGEEGRGIKGHKGRRARGHRFYGLREDVVGGAIT